MDLLGGRVALNPRPERRRRPILEVAMLGHCPGKVRLRRLGSNARAEMRRVGYAEAVESFPPVQPGSRELSNPTALHHTPVPIQSLAEFEDIFPSARALDTEYASLLADGRVATEDRERGGRAWLPQVVEDFFANGGEKLWIVSVPEGEKEDGFFPAAGTRLNDVRTLKGIATILVIPEVGVVALPDLERLEVPRNLPDIPPVSLEKPPPSFLPCATPIAEVQGEQADSSSSAVEGSPKPIREILEALQHLLAQHRPDIQCLYTLPLSYSSEAGRPVVDTSTLQLIEEMKNKKDASSAGLRRIQLLFPYLRGARYRLVSSVGLVAGLQASSANRQGVWRSMAGIPMLTDGKPYPPLSADRAWKLREAPGIGVIRYRGGHVILDDERLAVPALPRSDYVNAQNIGRFDGFRSGEVARFMGFLLRQLRALGELLVFDIDFRDSRPRLLLEEYFRRLYSAGALRGRLPEDAFDIREKYPQEGAVAYEIEVAPALPIDKVQLTFTNRTGEWQAELTNG